MKIHIIVGILVVDAFFLGVNMMGDNVIGIASGIVAIACFGAMYVGESVKGGNK